MSGDFKLSATLKGHEEDVRVLVYPSRETIFSASRDNTVRKWQLTSPQPPVYADTIALQGSHWFNSLAYCPPSQKFPDGLIAAGGRETFVFVKPVGSPPDAEPYRMLIGHAGNITCLAFSRDGSKIVSGGWDSQVFVWNVEEGSVSAELTGHGGPVWGLMVYDAKLVFTACADKIIRIFDIQGKNLKTIEGHTDVVRCFCKLPSSHSSGAAFASAGNDEVIRLWTLDGDSKGKLEGHTAYIYSLAVLPNGDIVSSSEDRTVKIWRDGQCIQTITHPAISLWAVAVCEDTGDIASGASDNVIRIFSRDPKRQASAETIQNFEESNKMYAIPAETANQGLPFQKETLPRPEALQTQIGQRDGQQLFVREHDGSVTAHLWSSSTKQWNLIGTVVSGEGTATSKKEYNGMQYDYVFDVDIKDGEPPLKLPFNAGDDPWIAAKKFLEDNELPMSYYEQVANWINQNTQGARIGQAEQLPPRQSDPWGTERRYRPGAAAANYVSGKRKLPERSYVTVSEGNAQNAINKIVESSKQLQSTGKLDAVQILSTDDTVTLNSLVSQLNNSPQDPRPTTNQIALLLTAASTWPIKERVPAIAILARLAVSPAFVSATSSNGKTIIDTLSQAGLFTPKQPTVNNVVHAIRLIVNLFNSDSGRSITDCAFDSTLELVRPFTADPESPAQYKALAALYLNYAVLLTTFVPSTISTSREARARILLIDIATLLESESPHATDTDAFYRTLCALGTLLMLSSSLKAEMKSGISGTLQFVGSKPGMQMQNVMEVVQEIRDELR